MDEMSVWDVLGLDGPGDKRSINKRIQDELKQAGFSAWMK